MLLLSRLFSVEGAYLGLVSGLGIVLLCLTGQSQAVSLLPTILASTSESRVDAESEFNQRQRLQANLDLMMERLAGRSLSLADAVTRTQHVILADYPRFLKHMGHGFQGKNERQTIAHHLVMRAIRTWGSPAWSSNTAALVHEYEQLYRPDARAQAHLAQFALDIWPAARYPAYQSRTAAVADEAS